MSNSRNKIFNKSLKKGFSPVPYVLLRCPLLSMQAKTLYALLLSYAWQTGYCFPGHNRLADDLGVHKNTVIRYLRELRKFGLIDWKQRGTNRTNIYFLLPLESIFPDVNLDIQQDVITESHSSVTQEIQQSVNIIETEEYNQNKYKQSFSSETNSPLAKTIKNENYKNNSKNLSDYDKEAFEIAKELKDLGNIRYYQSLINKRDKGLVENEDIQMALDQARRAMSESVQDGTNFLKNAGAWFTACFKKLNSKRQEKENVENIEKMKNLLVEKTKMK